MAIHLSPEQSINHPDHKRVCFIHARTLNHWADITYGQLKRLCSSGLYQKLDAVFINFVTDHINDPEYIQQFIIEPLSHYDDTVQFRILPEEQQWERPTLHWLHDYCSASVNNVEVLYLHSKGITHYGKEHLPCVEDWVNLMETVLIDHHQVSLDYLKKVDVCGTIYIYSHPYPPCYMGNKWWANSDYLKKLSPRVGSNHLDPEFWILTNHTVTFADIFNSGYGIAVHYVQPFPKERIPTEFQPVVYEKNGGEVRVIQI
ncbi:hypothetical protein [Thermoactinomyces sp. DSM 45892]|uniref:hypothetical protein n=1 Tax=Thermoactinomyces sp. DSM 45892 TaxID=1882753 RepID=UPI00089B3889|nr:hypothetical protein [Thermoactinomyces sp. DSM 45892]SDZ08470.1 hypothetical protein SAMN05444416_11328 [Thermoactinomyces sp. DSM 45892]